MKLSLISGLRLCLLIVTTSVQAQRQSHPQGYNSASLVNPSAAQVLQEHIRQENLRTQVWADRQTESRRKDNVPLTHSK